MKSGYMTCFRGAIIVLIMPLFLLSAGAPSAKAAPLTSAKPEIAELRIGLPALDPSFLPNWAADQIGFFKEEGFIDIKILGFQGGGPTVQALAGGTIDLCVTGLTTLVNTVTSGQKLKAFWAGYNMAEFAWYALPKYKSIAETKGGRYGVTRLGSLTDFLTRYALRRAGLNPEKDVNILQLGGQAQYLAAMSSGHLDVGIFSLPNTYMAAEKGFVRLMSQSELSRDYPTHVAYAKEEFIAKNPNTIKAYVRATTKAMEWIKANPNEAAKLVNKQLKYRVEYARKAIDDLIPGWHPDGSLPQDGMKIFWAVTVESGDVKEPWPNSKWLDDTFLRTQDQWRK
jgi:NitT/TauT family transport system substrate-binding protein